MYRKLALSHNLFNRKTMMYTSGLRKMPFSKDIIDFDILTGSKLLVGGF